MSEGLYLEDLVPVGRGGAGGFGGRDAEDLEGGDHFGDAVKVGEEAVGSLGVLERRLEVRVVVFGLRYGFQSLGFFFFVLLRFGGHFCVRERERERVRGVDGEKGKLRGFGRFLSVWSGGVIQFVASTHLGLQDLIFGK